MCSSWAIFVACMCRSSTYSVVGSSCMRGSLANSVVFLDSFLGDFFPGVFLFLNVFANLYVSGISVC